MIHRDAGTEHAVSGSTLAPGSRHAYADARAPHSERRATDRAGSVLSSHCAGHCTLAWAHQIRVRSVLQCPTMLNGRSNGAPARAYAFRFHAPHLLPTSRRKLVELYRIRNPGLEGYIAGLDHQSCAGA